MKSLITEDMDITNEEKIRIFEFAYKIKIHSFQDIFSYGGGLAKKNADITEKVVQLLLQNDIIEHNEKLTTQLKEMEKNYGQSKSFWIRKQKKDIMDKDMYTLFRILDEVKINLLKESAILKQFILQIEKIGKELEFYILAGELKIQDIKKETREERFITSFQNKINDLKITRQITLQTITQMEKIRQDNNWTIKEMEHIYHKLHHMKKTKKIIRTFIEETYELERIAYEKRKTTIIKIKAIKQ